MNYNNSGSVAASKLFLVTAILISALVAMFTFKFQEKTLNEELGLHGELVYLNLQKRIGFIEYALSSTVAFFNASNYVSEDEFKTFTDDILKGNHYIKNIAWLRFADVNEITRLQSEFKKKEDTTLDIYPHETTFKIGSKNFLLPAIHTNSSHSSKMKRGINFLDLVDPSNSEKFQSAIDACSKFTVISNKNNTEQMAQMSYVLIPVYKTKTSCPDHPDTEAEGFIALQVSISQLLRKTPKDLPEHVSLEVHNMNDKQIFSEGHSHTHDTNLHYSEITYKKDILFIDNVWHMIIHHQGNDAFYSASAKAILVFVLGFFISLTSYLWLQSILSTSRVIEETVNEKTRDLELSNQLLKLSEKTAKLGHWIYNVQESTVYWSDEIYEIHGVTKENYTPELETAIGFYLEEDIPFLQRELQHTIDTGAAFEINLRIRRRDNGKVSNINSKGYPELDNEGNVKSIFGIFQDITKDVEEFEKEAERQKLESLGVMAGGIAHEINNALTPILLLSKHSLDITSESDKGLSRNLEEIIKSGQHARNIVREILVYTRHKTEEPSLVEVGPLLEETISFYKNASPDSLIIKKRFSKDVKNSKIMVNNTEFMQLFTNLLNNAAYAMDHKNTINISAKVADENLPEDLDDKKHYAEIIVKDSGSGISQDEIDSIFDPFYTTKPEGDGSGLGLSVAYGLVKKWHGHIHIESAVGKGTKVWVYIPIFETV